MTDDEMMAYVEELQSRGVLKNTSTYIDPPSLFGPVSMYVLGAVLLTIGPLAFGEFKWTGVAIFTFFGVVCLIAGYVMASNRSDSDAARRRCR